MKKNTTNPSIQNEPGNQSDPNRKERERKGETRQVSDPEAYDDAYESREEDEIVREEARTEKDNRPGKS